MFAKPTPLNINLGSDRFAMFNKKWDIPGGGRVALRAEDLTDDEVAELTKDLRGCPNCDGIIGPQWKFCAFCGEKVPG